MKGKMNISLLICLQWTTLVFGQGGAVREWLNPRDSMIFVQVPAGKMMFHLTDTLRSRFGVPPDDLPSKEITFNKPFYLGRTEVTVAQFRKFVCETGYRTEAECAGNRFTWKDPGFYQDEDHPVTYVSCRDAQAYATWAGVDLPDEAEWLYACSSGTPTRYYWGDEMRPDLFWHRENSLNGTHPVATNQPNPWGLFDMVGNVKEYCLLRNSGIISHGESWVRCINCKGSNGAVYDFMFAESVQKILHTYVPEGGYHPYSWEDDRGFRCIMREKSPSY